LSYGLPLLNLLSFGYCETPRKCDVIRVVPNGYVVRRVRGDRNKISNMAREGSETDETGENFIMRSFITCTPHQILLGLSSQKEDEMGGAGSTHE
jgi:hypothetical protein